MAQVPKAVGDNPFEAAPEKLAGGPVPSPSPDVVDPLSGLSTVEIGTIKDNLAPMSNEALDRFFQSRGLSPDEISQTKALVEAVRRSEGITPEVESGFSDFAKAVPGVVGTLAKGAMAAGEMAVTRPREFISRAAPFIADLGVGIAAEAPALAAGAATAAIPGVGPFAAPLVAGAVGYLGTEASENAIRSFLGMDQRQYEEWENLLAGAGATIGAMGKTANSFLRKATESARPLDEAAFEGLKVLRGGMKNVMKESLKRRVELGLPKDLAPQALDALAATADELFTGRYTYNLSQVGSGLSGKELEKAKFLAFNQTLREMPDIVEGAYSAYDFRRLLPLTEAAGKVTPLSSKPGQAITKSGMERAQSLSKIRQDKSELIMADTISETIKRARAKGLEVGELMIPYNDVISTFENAISKYAPFVRSPDGLQLQFKNGSWGSFDPKRGGQFIRLGEEESKALRETIRQTNPFLNALYENYEAVSRGIIQPKRVPGEPILGTKRPTFIDVDELIRMKRNIGESVEPLSQAGATKGQNISYEILNDFENSYLQRVSQSPYFSAAQASQNYLQSKELSTLASKVFDSGAGKANLIANLNDLPKTTANAFISNMSDVDVRNFARLVNETVEGVPIMDKKTLKNIAAQIINERSQLFYGKITGQSGTFTKDAVQGLKESVDALLNDKDTVRKLKILLGEKEFESTMLPLRKAALVADQYRLRLQQVANLPADKQAAAAENLQKAFAAKATDIISSAAGTTIGSARGSFWTIKAIFDATKNREVSDQIAKMMVMRLDDLVVPNIDNVDEALKVRAQIVSAIQARGGLGKTVYGGDAMRILGKYDQAVEARLIQMRQLRIRNAKIAQATSAGLRSIPSAAADAILQQQAEQAEAEAAARAQGAGGA